MKLSDKKQPTTRMTAGGLLLPVLVLALMSTFYLEAANGQFFTKSSKSIPRMGRRSLEQPSMRRALIDRLVDEYGPNLLEVLQARAASENSREFAVRNDQPIDVAADLFQAENISDVDGAAGSNMFRNERSPLPSPSPSPSSAAGQLGGYRGANSLAMRALNANRLLQALSSGQPLMSYDKIYAPGYRQQDRTNSRDPRGSSKLSTGDGDI